MNEALLMKWWWRYGTEKESLWRKVIKSKYKMGDGGWTPKMEFHRKVSNIWKDIMMIEYRKPQIHATYAENAKIQVGNGNSILFWKDTWLGNISLSLKFPTLFNVVASKRNAWVMFW